MARKQKELIKAATIATVLDKLTNAILGFVVKSNSSEEYYQITFLTLEDGSHEFFCTCQSADYGFHNCAPDVDGNKCCCHIKAVKEVLVAKAELARAEEAEAAQAAVAEAEAVLAEVQASAPKYAPPSMGGFNRRGASCYVSDAEMAAIKACVAARKAAATLNPNVGFQLMR